MNGFTVLPDGKSIAAAMYCDPEYLQVENITDKNSTHQRILLGDLMPFVVTYNSHQSTLIAANYWGSAVGFRLSVDGSSFSSQPVRWSATSHLPEMSELHGSIAACDNIGSLTVLAGDTLVIVDTATNRVFHKSSVECAIGFIRFAKFCRVPGKLLLAVGGQGVYYSGSNTDLFDITSVAKEANLQVGQDHEVVYALAEFGG